MCMYVRICFIYAATKVCIVHLTNQRLYEDGFARSWVVPDS
jgi:hypothetical protein